MGREPGATREACLLSLPPESDRAQDPLCHAEGVTAGVTLRGSLLWASRKS